NETLSGALMAPRVGVRHRRGAIAHVVRTALKHDGRSLPGNAVGTQSVPEARSEAGGGRRTIMDDLTRLPFVAQLERDEVPRNRAYQYSRGIWTVGVGHNLEARPLSDHAIDVIRDDDIRDVERELVTALPWVTNLDPVRYVVLLNMAFNLGVPGLLGFHK